MTGGHFTTVLSDERISVVGHIVFGVSFTSMSDFDVGSVGVGRSEVGDVEAITG